MATGPAGAERVTSPRVLLSARPPSRGFFTGLMATFGLAADGDSRFEVVVKPLTPFPARISCKYRPLFSAGVPGFPRNPSVVMQV